MQPRFSPNNFHHRYTHRVRSHECDRQSVVHNARYLEILEVARIEYCRDILGMPMDSATFASHNKFVFVRNAIDYFSPARFDDSLTILTRISRVGTTSVTFEQLILRDAAIIVEAEAVMVALDELSDLPMPVSTVYRNRAEEWESQ